MIRFLLAVLTGLFVAEWLFSPKPVDLTYGPSFDKVYVAPPDLQPPPSPAGSTCIRRDVTGLVYATACTISRRGTN